MKRRQTCQEQWLDCNDLPQSAVVFVYRLLHVVATNRRHQAAETALPCMEPKVEDEVAKMEKELGVIGVGP